MFRFRSVCVLATLLAAGAFSASAQAVDLAPHRAIYDMKLGVSKRSSGVIDVNGSMVVETAESCEGWEVSQRVQLTYLSSDADEVQTESNFASFESKDGLTYRFNVRNMENGELQEELRGNASIDRKNGAGRAIFSKPERKEFPLSAGTLFPTAHVVRLIEKASTGERFLPFSVFDGARLEGAFDVNAVVTGTEPKAALAVDHKLLRDQKLWAMRLAFFPADKNEPEPEYEISVELMANGVSRAMVLDYGNFTVIGSLQKIEDLPRAKCGSNNR